MSHGWRHGHQPNFDDGAPYRGWRYGCLRRGGQPIRWQFFSLFFGDLFYFIYLFIYFFVVAGAGRRREEEGRFLLFIFFYLFIFYLFVQSIYILSPFYIFVGFCQTSFKILRPSPFLLFCLTKPFVERFYGLHPSMD